MQTEENKLEVIKEVIELPSELKDVIKSSKVKDLSKAEKIALGYAPFFKDISVQIEKLKQLEKGGEGHGAIAKRIRLDLGHIASDAGDQKKEDKAFLLIETRLIDSFFNTVNGIARLTQEEAKEIEEYELRIEQKRKDDLCNSRTNELNQYEIDSIPSGLGDMDQSVYEIFLSGIKATNEAKKEAERKAEEEKLAQAEKEKLYTTRKTVLIKYKAFCNITLLELDTSDEDYQEMFENAMEAKDKHDKEQVEIQRRQKLYNYRKELMLPLSQFCMIDQLTLNMTNDEWDEFSSDAESKKADHHKKQEEIRLENEKLKKEKEELHAKTIKDKEVRKVSAIEFLKSNDFEVAHDGMTASRYDHFIGENHYSDFETDKELESFKEAILKDKEIEEQRLQHLKEDQDRKEKEEEAQRIRIEELEQERAKNQRLAEELKAKEDQEAEEKKEREEKARAEALAPEKEKIEAWINTMLITPIGIDGFSKEGVAVCNEVFAKFHSFKNWANSEVDKLK